MRPSSIRAKLISRIAPAVIITLAAILPAAADELTLQENAPDRYVVVKGDTLWDISGKFLKHPWKWPEIWNMNKDEIKDPHWIYPGDVIVLDMSSGNPRLRLLGNDANDARRSRDKLNPKVRVTQFDNMSSPPIPTSAIVPFLTQPLVVEESEFLQAPRIAQNADDRVTLTTGDTAYAVGVTGNPGDQWQVFNGGKLLRDPDTKEVLGYEVLYVGDAVTRQVADVSTISVTKVARELALGDRLIPKPRMAYPNYVPHIPTRDVEGKIISTVGGVNDAGPYTTVVINRGERDGLELGHVLNAYKAPRPIKAASKAEKGMMTPAERNGYVFIYRVFPKVSYGLALNGTRPLNLLDVVRKP
ncbi:LysM peptidoglycan-binding domain-containing protein [Chitinimonas viridis]|uniref:LysM peptidoglycan-binding domain-containing protein n=1 Tax=Chitinimonas viridis TaxID=664880 RepID=A0ABT8B8J7_9NEIS|nr:LysM peptidoglycan-binding domain-containing protein [Chitinimonas viridis]MDN3578112.1 LysM peptidoglycan-binding domain-containing protein [Chitinimonas viridis]